MSRNDRCQIPNGYCKFKQTRQYQGYKVTSYTTNNYKIAPQPPASEATQKQDENFLRLKRRVQLHMKGDKIFKLYSRISQSIGQCTQDNNVVRKVRQVESQLLKLILRLSFEAKQSMDKRILMTQNISKQNSTTKPPSRNLQTSVVKKRRAFQQSLMQSSSSNFQKFKINESLKRLEVQLQRIPQRMAGFPVQKVDASYLQIQKQLEECKFSERYLSQELTLKNMRLNNLVKQIEEYKANLESSEQQVISLRSENSSLLLELKNYREGLRYQELWRMASQQVQTLSILNSELQRQRKHLNRKYKVTRDRLNELIKQRSSGAIDETKQDMEDLKFLIAEINQTFKRSNNLEQTEKPLYKLPNVLVLFEEDKLKESDVNGQKSKVLGADFFLKLRGIMDSKYNEFWSCTQAKNCMSLADFAMGFMDKFTIDPKYKKITMNGSNMEQTQKTKLQFVLDLSSSKLKDVIQISLFKEFLFEQRSKDELFFYLSCRHVLFNGHVLDNTICSQDPIIFIPLDRAYKVIDQILINFDKNLTDRIKQALNLKRKKKAHKFFVDGHFLLKALLQLYSLERKKKLSIFKRSLVNQDPRRKQITFKVLKKFLNRNYQFVTNSQITELYRGCWKLTHGRLQIQTLFNMCDWIFIQELKDQIFLPKRFNNQYKQWMDKVYVHTEQGKYFTRRILELGGEKLLVYANKLKQLLALRSRDNLNVQHLFGLMNMLQLPRTLKIIQILATSGSNKQVKIPYLGPNDFRISEFEDITAINTKNEEHRRKLKEAAEKIGIYFDRRIKTVYRRFGADINKQLAELSMVIP